MRIPKRLHVLPIFLALALLATPSSGSQENDHVEVVERENEQFWSRYMEETASSLSTPEPTDAPTPNPTPAPSSSPSAQPSSAPSSLPTPAPSSAPTPEPSAAPSSEPSAAPSTEPSTAPSAEPSAAPSPEPSAEPTSFCLVDVKVDCATTDGTPCVDIQPPPGQCSVGNEVDVAKFRITDCTCGESRNSQDDEFVCDESTQDLPVDGTPVQVSCTDGSGTVFFDETSAIGEHIAVQDGTTGGLPELTTCTVSDDQGNTLQTLTINTSGEVDFYLKDKYGMLQLEGCEVEGQPEQVCIVPVAYTYTLENIGSSEMDITILERTRNNVTVDLIDQVSGSNPLQPGETVSTTETEDDFDVCVDGVFKTTVVAEADPPTGVPCIDTDTYEFELDFCLVDVEIGCQSSDGTQCTDLVPPPGQCSVGDEIDIAKFRITDCTCDESKNSQDENFTCDETTQDLPADGTPVQVSCTDGSGTVFFNETSAIGEAVNVQDPATGGLPDVMTCTVSDESGNVLQTLTINTSGQVDFYLKDKYGMLELEACEVDGQPEQNCIVPIVYTYTLENVGSSDMDITILERTRNNVTVDLIDDVSGFNPMQPGDVVSTTEEENLDLCVDGTYKTTIVAEADPPNGVPCVDTETYEFEVENTCRVDVDIACVSEDGVECNELGEQDGECSAGSGLTTLTLRHVDSSCDQGSDQQGDVSTCEDMNGGLTGGAVSVSCVDELGGAVGDTAMVIPDETFAISDPAGLPSQLTCTLSNTDGTTLQVVTFDASGEADLILKDRFGGLTLEACTDSAGAERDCFTDITWTFDAINVGTNDMNVTLIEIERGTTVIDLTDQVQDPELSPGESTQVTYEETIDLCVPGNYTTVARAEADPPGDGMCQSEEPYVFEVDVGCDVYLDMGCTVVGEGMECSELTGEQEVECICDQCANQLIFRYTGESLPNIVSVVVADGSGTEVFSGNVTVGDDVVVSNSACVGDSHAITISDVTTGEELQSSIVDTSCGGEITLLDSIGGVDFVGYTCAEDNVAHNCFTDIEYSYVVDNTGEVDLTITTLETTLNGESTDLTLGIDPAELTLVPGDKFETTKAMEIELCISHQYSGSSSVEAESSDASKVCLDDDEYHFEVSTGTPFPSPSPSAAPSPTPSSSPSDSPTPEPSAAPSAQPSTEPSSAPSAQPSAAPSAQPSAEPSSEPSAQPSAAPSAQPSAEPSSEPSAQPSAAPSTQPSAEPSSEPSAQPSAAPSTQPSAGPSSEPSAQPSAAPSAQPSAEPSSEPSAQPSAAPSAQPSARPSSEPSAQPSAAPSSQPSAEPSSEPSAQPSASPSAQPSSAPSKEPSSAPSKEPSVAPSSEPSEPPSSQPSDAPSPTPSEQPSPTPSQSPSASPTTSAPTGACDVTIDMTCTASDGTACTDISGEKNPQCSCAECVREIVFRYTAAECGDTEMCQDFDGGPQVFATLAVVDIEDASDIFFNDIVQVGDDIVVTRPDGSADACLPAGLEVIILDAAAVSARQEIQIESDCSGRGDLVLLDSHGALDFIGYTCNAGDIHNCYVDVEYELDACNTGTVDLTVTTFDFTSNNETTSLIEGVPADELTISPSDCYESTNKPDAVVDRCSAFSEYQAEAFVDATSEIEGPPCQDSELLEFSVEVGTLPPSPAPSSQPSAAPSPEPSAQPSPAPSSQPSSAPSSQPSAQPSPAPSSQPSAAPSSQPSSQPSASPSAAPSPAPSAQPSSVPTEAGTPAPSPAPTDACDLDLEIGCTPPLGADSCDTIPPLLTICQQRPFEMIFRFNGGDCSGSYNIQPDDLFQCTDFQGGPPSIDDELSYITAFELGGGEVYFSGFVLVGEEFTMLAEEKFSANMNITVYDPNGSTDPTEIVQPSNMLQTLVYHSSCSQNLFLKDRFGSVQLVVFVNEEQGTVTCFQNVTLTFEIDVPIEIEGGEVTLTALSVITNIENEDGGIFDFSEKVAGKRVTRGDPCRVEEKIQIDLTARRQYTALSTVVGRTDEGKGCFGTDFYKFTAGNPLPPIFPTMAPSAAPTISPFPTPDPDTSACSLETEISCRVLSGGSCRDLFSPAGTSCTGSNAELLQFIYIPSSLCDGNNTQDKFKCKDENLEISRPSSAYVRFSKKDEIYFMGVANAGQIFNIPLTGEKDMDIEIFTVENNGPGTLLQESKMVTECDEDAALSLLSTFGHLQLVGYRNQEQGLQQIFADLEFTYEASNIGRLSADLTSAISSHPFSDSVMSWLDDGERRIMAASDVEIFVETITLNLVEAAGSNFDFTFLAGGEGSTSGVSCQDTDLYTLNVN